MGLAGMRERITSLGGYVSIDDAQGQGFELVVGLPVPSGRAQ